MKKRKLNPNETELSDGSSRTAKSEMPTQEITTKKNVKFQFLLVTNTKFSDSQTHSSNYSLFSSVDNLNNTYIYFIKNEKQEQISFIISIST